ncbi:MAG: ATP-dependent Clp protease proteolytic subunit [Oscillospiraceae bacterium]|nr:ATP-dependent Clp protease proteolytic subunit [Oscillospiraceae bacterium]
MAHNEGGEERLLFQEGGLPEALLLHGGGEVPDARHTIRCLTVIGQVEGHYELDAGCKTTKYEHIIPALVDVEQDRSIEGLLVLLNTVGGDVEAGLAIAELIAGMKTPTVSLVVGGGHSIGVPLAVSADVSLIAPSAAMTVHPVRMSGMVLGVPQSLTYIDKIQSRLVSFVVGHSRISEEKLRSLMTNTRELATDVGSVLTGEQAVAAGLIDAVGGLSDALEALYARIEETEKRYV